MILWLREHKFHVILFLFILFVFVKIAFPQKPLVNLSETQCEKMIGKTLALKNKPYYRSENIYSGVYTGQCTWYAHGRFREVTGISLGNKADAKWWLNAQRDNPKVSIVDGADNITSPAIAVSVLGRFGHVVFIEHVVRNEQGDPITVYFTECNGGGKNWVLKKVSYAQFASNMRPVGYIIPASHTAIG